MSAVDASGKFVELNIVIADSPGIRPNVTVGTCVWFSSQTSACTIEPPNVMLWLRLIHVALFSITFVDASRDEFAAVPAPVVVTPLARLVSVKPVPQQALLKFKR